MRVGRIRKGASGDGVFAPRLRQMASYRVVGAADAELAELRAMISILVGFPVNQSLIIRLKTCLFFLVVVSPRRVPGLWIRFVISAN
jgi:hypothetical protein